MSELRRLGAGLPVSPSVCPSLHAGKKLTWNQSNLLFRRPASRMPEAGWSMAGLSVRGDGHWASN